MTAVAHTSRHVPVPPAATVRTQVTVPLRFPDGYSTTADVLTFHGLADGKEHLLLALGPWEQALLGADPATGSPAGAAPLVRMHSECMTGDVFGSERCDCGPQLREAVEQIAGTGGFLLYLRQEGRGIGLYSKLDAYALQDTGLDTYDANLALGHAADERDYTAAAQMLHALGATSVRLLSNNPDKAAQLAGFGIGITESVATGVHLSAANGRYLAAKRDRTAHTLVLPAAVEPSAVERSAGNASAVPAPAGIPDPADLLARVEALVPALQARAADTEAQRRLPADTVADLHGAGVFRVLVPKALGGFGMGADTYAEVIRLLARGCASTAWTAGHLMEHAWMLARWPRQVQDEVFSHGTMPLAAATSAPAGTARTVPGGLAITGHWRFASGILHSEWALLAVDLDGVRLQCLVPVPELELQDAWHTDGLRGTGSNDLLATDLFVPGYRTLAWEKLAAPDNPGSRIHPEPLIQAPIGTLLNLVAPSVALGAAESAVDLFRDRLQAGGGKNPVGRQADSPLAQARFARAFGQLASARLLWTDALGAITTAGPGKGPDPTEAGRAEVRLLLGLSADAAQDAVRLVMAGSGAGVHRLAHPLQRIQRDIGVLVNHPTLSLDPILERAGRDLLVSAAGRFRSGTSPA
ncbi:GTP cyclohydrolase [Arthrobacter sp. ZBG10]|uniref:GTP cyclohydrolase II RibA n=1 Tax=Arthrobacter sp. ZBG10 TaxID=1676590 RepID=UPI0006818EEC|nr:GTP cyclohydrolase II RibA [Arthrobacter sp. ZBG10]KNH17846.1 GTP cyclohydrolase [Arthrobacter sp. ZBG10]